MIEIGAPGELQRVRTAIYRSNAAFASEHRLRRNGPVTWRNSDLPWYVVQAMPATAPQPGEPRPPAFHERPCFRFTGPVDLRPADCCAGLSEHAMSGVPLEREHALHAVRQHYIYANWSICRFASHIRGDYAADLIFEVDAHVKGFPDWQLDHRFYEPIVEAAVTAGSKLIAYLITKLEVDLRYVTACVTRMGCRVTVDWRAFGPRRLWMLLAVVRWIENQVFERNELVRSSIELRRRMLVEGERLGGLFAKDFGPLDPMKVTATVKVDGAIYARSDLPRLDPEHGGNRFKGPFVRPVGSLHSGSSSLNLFCRTTPVAHDRFAPEYTEWLTKVSRAPSYNPTYGPSIHDHVEPKLFYDLWKWPEARDPRGDRLVETAPFPCCRLVELFDRVDELQDDLPEEVLDEIKSVRRQALGSGIRSLGETRAEIEPADAEKILSSLKEAKYQRGGRVRAICPFCDKLPVSLTVYTSEGHGHCFRCVRTFSLADIAGKLGLENVVRWRRHSSSPIQRVPLESLPQAPEVSKWGDNAVLISPEFDTLQGARADQSKVIDRYLSERDGWDLLILRGPTGLGKTYEAIDQIGRHGIISRGLFARSESRAPYLSRLSPSRSINGRRPGNCSNYARIAKARDRLIPEWTICKQCEHRSGCPYLAQFEDIEGVHLGLLHSHAPHLDRPLIDNGAEITFVDENAWERCIELIDIDARELDLFRCDAHVAHRDHPCRRIVITRIGHRDRSEATLAGGWSGGGFGLALSA